MAKRTESSLAFEWYNAFSMASEWEHVMQEMNYYSAA